MQAVEESRKKLQLAHNHLVVAHQKIGDEIKRFEDWQSRVESWISVITSDYVPFMGDHCISTLGKEYDKCSVEFLAALVALRDYDKQK